MCKFLETRYLCARLTFYPFLNWLLDYHLCITSLPNHTRLPPDFQFLPYIFVLSSKIWMGHRREQFKNLKTDKTKITWHYYLHRVSCAGPPVRPHSQWWIALPRSGSCGRRRRGEVLRNARPERQPQPHRWRRDAGGSDPPTLRGPPKNHILVLTGRVVVKGANVGPDPPNYCKKNAFQRNSDENQV